MTGKQDFWIRCGGIAWGGAEVSLSVFESSGSNNNGSSSTEPVEASPAFFGEEEKALMPGAVAAASTTTVGRSLSAPAVFGEKLTKIVCVCHYHRPLPPQPYQRHSGNCSAHVTVAEVIRPFPPEQKEVPHRQPTFWRIHVMNRNASGTEKFMNCKSNTFSARSWEGGLH
ncbi:hypothetical protein TcBrA4_0069220 [Trypanosoma cruzi]|nr:hypothetical protein TcBrA4_0069220 [Trypanosoma cruzi]